MLKGKLPLFRWGKEQQDSYELVRDKLLGGIHLVAPDFELPFHLQTDTSEDGKGGILYQLPTIPIAEQYPFSARIHSPENMAVVTFYSKAWNNTQRSRPPFYLEADSLLWCSNESKFYALILVAFSVIYL